MRGPQAFPAVWDKACQNSGLCTCSFPGPGCFHAQRPKPAALADMDRGRDSKEPLQVPAVQMPASLISHNTPSSGR